MDQLAIKWNIKKPEDWFKVTIKMVKKEYGGSFLRTHYKGSMRRGSKSL
jgi:hypothetical protein